MEELIEKLRPISGCLDRVQSTLAMDFLNDRLLDVDGRQKSLGRTGIMSCFLGILWGIHVAVAVACFVMLFLGNLPAAFSPAKVAMISTWCFYVATMCTFHLMEFFVTAFYNPTVVASDSFLVNHSKAYTVASMIAGTEFWLGFWLGGNDSSSTNVPSALWWTITVVGMVMVVVSQIMRSCAMMKCGESFNHYIQMERKENHVLVTDGIYTWFRHPSYTGFYYWSVGTQVVLHNSFSAVLFAVAGWKFFAQRIPYEERSLVRLFGDEYYHYVGRSYVGIPFIPALPRDEEQTLRQEGEGEKNKTEDSVEVGLGADPESEPERYGPAGEHSPLLMST